MDTPVGPGALSAIRPRMAALPEQKIAMVAAYGRDRPGLIPLWYGEGDLPTPRFIGDAAAKALAEGHTFYTHQRGIPPLREALARYQTRLAGRDLDVERVTVTSSGMTAILHAMQLLVDPGDEVVVITPVWPNVFSAVGMQNGEVRTAPLTLGDNGWQLDLDRVTAACGPRTRAVFVNSPGNPTGWTMPREDMVRLRDFARSRGLWIVSDEVYNRLYYDGAQAPSFLEITEPEDRLIVVNSFSKNWAMTGWRVGWMITPPALGPVLENLVQYTTSGTPTFLQHAAVTALDEGEPFVQALVERCRGARDLVCGRLAALPRIRVTTPPGAFYAFFSVEGETDSVALARRIIDEANVGLAPGAAFGPGGEGYLRLCFAASPELLETALDRIAPVLA